jgi:polysaccharide biosynthesis/export protein
MKKLFFLLAIGYGVTSCLTYKDILNFQDGQDLSTGRLDSITNFAKWTIQTEDILMVNVFSSNQEAVRQFNIMNPGAMGNMQMFGGQRMSEAMIGYRVDSEGNIDIPVIGKVRAKGKTTEEVKIEVEQKIRATEYLKDVNVQVTYLTFRITILGEVNAPGSHILMSQKVNVLEAIGLSGDLTLFANRDNILVIREKENVRSYARLNLKSKEIFNSPYFYLQPGDIVYVEPVTARILSTPDPATRYTSTIVGIASLITLVLTLAN